MFRFAFTSKTLALLVIHFYLSQQFPLSVQFTFIQQKRYSMSDFIKMILHPFPYVILAHVSVLKV